MADAQSTRQHDDARATVASQFEALSLTDSAATRIAQRINSGEIRPGQRLPPERTLALELDVSRPALREALHALQSAGLVVARRGSGWYVTEHGSDTGAGALASWMQLQPIGDTIAVRRVLEPEAIRALPATRTAEIAAECDEILKGMRRALRDGDHRVAAELHSAFHRSLVQHAATRLMRTLLASMIDAAETAQEEIFRTPRAGSHSLARHRWIVDALRTGDVEETARRISEHLEPAFTYPRAGRSRRRSPAE